MNKKAIPSNNLLHMKIHYLVMLFIVLSTTQSLFAQAPIRYTLQNYEDSVRIAILYNTQNGMGDCPSGTTPVGPLTKDFVVKSLGAIPAANIDGIPSQNIKVVPSRTTTWADIEAMWGGGVMPHVIVHVQAGWYTENGPYLENILNTAADQLIGVVSVGDDAAFFGRDVFGIVNAVNVPPPLGTGRWLNQSGDKLWIDLPRSADTLPDPGIIRNAVDSILKLDGDASNDQRVSFKPHAANGRCEADADKYNVLPEFELNFLGFQNGSDASAGGGALAGANELPVIAAFQDSSRRGVALSFQPQYLAHETASYQIVYDAIIYASFAHLFNAKLPKPRAIPPTTSFAFQQQVVIQGLVPDVTIYYSVDNNPFQVYLPGTVLTFLEDTRLRAYSELSGWVSSDTMVENYTKEASLSTMILTDADGNQLSGVNYLTEIDAIYNVSIQTSYAGLESVAVSNGTVNSSDTYPLTITNPQNTGSELIFTAAVPFSIGPANTTDGAIQASNYDTLNVSWTNPENPADVLTQSVIIRPEPKQAVVTFTQADFTTPLPLDQLASDAAVLYIVVEDQIIDPTRLGEYNLILTNVKGVAVGPTDLLTFNLANAQDLGPGRYGVTVQLTALSVPTNVVQGNQIFEASVGDQIIATYIDPVDNDQAVDQVGFGIATEVPGTLHFTTDGTFITPFTPPAIWPPQNGFVYLRYVDDIAPVNKEVIIQVVNTFPSSSNPAATSIDRDTLTMTDPGNTGTWTVAVPLADNPTPVPGDGTLQIYFEGVMTATVKAHKNDGLGTETGENRTAQLTTAYANGTEAINLSDAQVPSDSSIITRFTEQGEVCVTDQVFSTFTQDTLHVTLQCTGTGDVISPLLVIQTSNTSTEYCGTFDKDENASTLGDGVLSCLNGDDLEVVYIDPVYGTSDEAHVILEDNTLPFVQILNMQGQVINSLAQLPGGPDQFQVLVTDTRDNLNIANTLQVLVQIPGGDSVIVTVTEIPDTTTGEYNGTYLGVVDYAFTQNPSVANNVIEGLVDPNSTINVADIDVSVITHENGNVATLLINAAYLPAEKAWIIDGNNDGKGDSIFVEFKQLVPFTSLPDTVYSLDWNIEGLQNHNAIKVINEVSANIYNPNQIVLTTSPFASESIFPQDVTSAGVPQPTLVLPNNSTFLGQIVPIEDKIGPVVVAAIRHPSNGEFYETGQDPNNPGVTFLAVNPDTFHIVISEPLTYDLANDGDWNNLVYFFSSDTGRDGALPLITFDDGVDGNFTIRPGLNGQDTLVFIVTNEIGATIPLGTDSLFLNSQANYTDLAGNPPGERGVLAIGLDPIRTILSSVVYIPVVGADMDNPLSNVNASIALGVDSTGIPLGTRDDGDGTYSMIWVQPRCLNADGSVNPDCYANCRDDNYSADETGVSTINSECLSTVKAQTEGPYKAEVRIFDHMGKFVHASDQYFGLCGEMDNPSRNIAQLGKGTASWLVWNLKDPNGDFVGSGVYLWKIRYIPLKASGDAPKVAEDFVDIKRQGFIRNNQENNCKVPLLTPDPGANY